MQKYIFLSNPQNKFDKNLSFFDKFNTSNYTKSRML